MKIIETTFKDLVILEPTVFADERGYFLESFNKQKTPFLEKVDFVQDNESLSQKDVLRGLHFQNPPFAQAKLVRVIKGAVLDVVIDLRKKSITYGKHFAIELSEQNKKQLFVPRGFAHGFLTLEDNTIFSYKCDNYYNPKEEISINCFDKTLNINWNKGEFILSNKDKNGIDFSTFESPF